MAILQLRYEKPGIAQVQASLGVKKMIRGEVSIGVGKCSKCGTENEYQSGWYVCWECNRC
jgi:hypothetical protein